MCVLVNKVYWNRAMPVCLQIIYDCFVLQQQNYVVPKETACSESLKYLFLGFLQKSC